MLSLLQSGVAVFSPVNSNVYSCYATQAVILTPVTDRKRSKKSAVAPYARKRASGCTLLDFT